MRSGPMTFMPSSGSAETRSGNCSTSPVVAGCDCSSTSSSLSNSAATSSSGSSGSSRASATGALLLSSSLISSKRVSSGAWIVCEGASKSEKSKSPKSTSESSTLSTESNDCAVGSAVSKLVASKSKICVATKSGLASSSGGGEGRSSKTIDPISVAAKST